MSAPASELGSIAAGPAWAGACAALAIAWTVAAAWRAQGRIVGTSVRGLLGGALAAAGAYGSYELLGLAGVELTWEKIVAPGWAAVARALLIGAIEEGAKLGGIALALRSRDARDARDVFRTTMAVSAVFGVVEAGLLADGWSWPVALGRAALAPVAHGALAIPIGFALLAPAGHRGGRQSAWRIGAAWFVAASLHGLGDWSLAQGEPGGFGFVVAMLVPVLWLYARFGDVPASSARTDSVRSSARNSSATPQACATQPRGV